MSEKRLSEIEASQARTEEFMRGLKESFDKYAETNSEMHKVHFQTREEFIEHKGKHAGFFGAVAAVAAVLGWLGSAAAQIFGGKG